MRRVEATSFRGSPQQYVAQIRVTTEEVEDRWGPSELTQDDLGEWFTFVFALNGGILAALVRELDNAPAPGYILTAIGGVNLNQVLEDFLAECSLDSERVLHRATE
ncbi:hypothetical protein LRS74_33335 [Streptomyces sp. LX-29]|uniref:hypothetical protein n=1 Tax=Streptomyces sp. LX-29 TaxID=2900152 RepID=UPI00240D26C3|nr:hypothetical protein [Streptomyces sp. LX-29]WFB11368.1 hypothetical protein LRS74_33335 [Streptomyces sp. LX-29]